MSPSTTPRHPHRNPTNSAPCEITPFRTAPRITALSPGQSPPLVKIPIFMCCLHTQLSVTIRAGLYVGAVKHTRRMPRTQGSRPGASLRGLLLVVLCASGWTGVLAWWVWHDTVVFGTSQRMCRAQPRIDPGKSSAINIGTGCAARDPRSMFRRHLLCTGRKPGVVVGLDV